MAFPVAGYVAIAAASAISGYLQSEAQKSAANKAAELQNEAQMAAIAEQRRQFDSIQKLLAPYVSAGNTALTQQMTLAGLAGTEAQQQAITNIEQGPLFKALARQGEESILQSASATGGVRGGNIKGVLAQYRPAMLKQEIESQYARLGGLSSLGQASAAQTAASGANSANAISNILQAGGEAQAQAALASGQATANMWGNFGNTAGLLGAAYLYNQNQTPQYGTTQGAAGGSAGKF